MSLLGFDATGRQALGQITNPPPALVSLAWFIPLAEPVRVPAALRAAANPVEAATRVPPVPAYSWPIPFAEPVRTRPINPAVYRQDFFMQMAPSPFVATGWRAWLSEPKRFPKGLNSALQPFLTQDTNFIPAVNTLIKAWLAPFSEPIRFKLGLPAGEQQFLAYHPRLVPKPNVTGTMLAIGVTSDGAIFAINVLQSQPAASAKVSIFEVSGGNSATSIRER